MPRRTRRSSKLEARFPDARSVLADAYAHNVSDEFVVPAVVADYRGIQDGDGVLCFNYRADRVRGFRFPALLDPAFSAFPRRRRVRIAVAAGMTEYSNELASFLEAVFPPMAPRNVLGDVVANAGCTQLRMAETEKYAHVTYSLMAAGRIAFQGRNA